MTKKYRKCPVCGKAILPDDEVAVRKNFEITHLGCNQKKHGYYTQKDKY